MHKSRKIETFVREKTAEGSFNSKGEFGLSRELQLEKVSGLWESSLLAILRLVQLGIALDSDRSEVKINAKSVEVSFIVDEFHPKLITSAPRFNEVLNYLVQSGNHPILFKQPGSQAMFSDKVAEKIEPLKPGGYKIVISLAKPDGFWKQMTYGIKFRGSLTMLLYRRLGFSHVRFGGGQITNQGIKSIEPKRFSKTLTLLGNSEARDDSINVASYNILRRTNDSLRIRKKANPAFFGRQNWKENFIAGYPLAHFYLGTKESSEPQLCFVKNGVLVGKTHFKAPGVVSAAMLDTDISGLKLVSNSKVERLVEYLNHCVEKAED